jgi:dihydroorotase-like cyclic amidohydrolase
MFMAELSAPCISYAAGLQYLLPATWTAVKEVGVDLLQLSHLLSSNPALLAGLRYKGLIAPGMDADIVVSNHGHQHSSITLVSRLGQDP